MFSGGTEKLILTKLRKSLLVVEGAKSRAGKLVSTVVKEVKLNGKVQVVDYFGRNVMDLALDSEQDIVRTAIF